MGQRSLDSQLAFPAIAEPATPRHDGRDHPTVRLPCRARVWLKCPACGHRMTIDLRCRPDCPICGGRRASPQRLAAMIPRVPVRHWVLSVPASWRARLAADAHATRALTAAFVESVLATTRSRCSLSASTPARGGAASIVHRFGARLDLNLHVHLLVLDGVYSRDIGDDAPRFTLAEPPTAADLHQIHARLAARFSQRLGGGPAPVHLGTPVFGPKDSAVRQRQASGPEAHRLDDAAMAERLERPTGPKARNRDQHGLHVHSSARVDATSRGAVIDLCDYLARPTIDLSRFEQHGERYLYRLPKPFHDGTVAIEFSPDEMATTLERLVTPTPAGRVRFHGVLAPRAAKRWFPGADQLSLALPPGPVVSPPARSPRHRPPPADPARSTHAACRACGETMQPIHVEELREDEVVGTLDPAPTRRAMQPSVKPSE